MANYILRNVVLSYPSLFTPRKQTGQNVKPDAKPRYEADFLIPKGYDLTGLRNACADVAIATWGDKVKNMQLVNPFKGHLTKTGNQRFDPDKYQCVIHAWSYNAPGLVSRYKGPDGKPAPILHANPKLLYPGCIVNASVSPFPFDNSGNVGISFGLQNIQMWGDGDRLDGRVLAEDEFQGEDGGEADIAALGAPENAGTAESGPAGGGRRESLAGLFG